jgi:peroxiredoxin
MDSVARIDMPAPDFRLADLDGVPIELAQARGQILVLNFWSAECPWSRRTDTVVRRAVEEAGGGSRLWAIASNAGESVADLRAAAGEAGLQLVLLDPDQQVADLYGAAATPHVFVVDAAGVLRYSGAPDDSTFRQREATRHYVVDALAALGRGSSPAVSETKAQGCAIVRKEAMGEK